MSIRILTAGAMAMLAMACASQTEQPARAQTSAQQCFFLNSVGGYTYAGGNKVHVSTGANTIWEFETLGPCPELSHAQKLAFDPTTSGAICKGIDVDLIVPTSIGPQRCPVTMIRKLEKGE